MPFLAAGFPTMLREFTQEGSWRIWGLTRSWRRENSSRVCGRALLRNEHEAKAQLLGDPLVIIKKGLPVTAHVLQQYPAVDIFLPEAR